MLIECTKKLSDAMKIKPANIVPIKREPFFEWHANLFTFQRRKGVFLMNNQTRYSITLYGLKAEHFKKFDSIVLSAIKETFLAEGFSEDQVDAYIEKCGEVILTKTHDRSILGQMNDFFFAVTSKLEDYIPSETLNIIEVNKWTGKLLCGTFGHMYPIEILKKEMDNMLGN